MCSKGVVKNVIPAITSINAIVAADRQVFSLNLFHSEATCFVSLMCYSVNEALKLATNCYKRMDSFMMYNGKVWPSQIRSSLIAHRNLTSLPLLPQDGVYSYTYPVERLQAKGHPAFPLAVLRLNVSGNPKLLPYLLLSP